MLRLAPVLVWKVQFKCSLLEHHRQTKQCLANTDVTTSALRADRVSVILDTEDTEAVLNARKPDKLGFRRKRETIANMLNNFIRTLSEEEVSSENLDCPE